MCDCACDMQPWAVSDLTLCAAGDAGPRWGAKVIHHMDWNRNVKSMAAPGSDDSWARSSHSKRLRSLGHPSTSRRRVQSPPKPLHRGPRQSINEMNPSRWKNETVLWTIITNTCNCWGKSMWTKMLHEWSWGVQRLQYIDTCSGISGQLVESEHMQKHGGSSQTVSH